MEMINGWRKIVINKKEYKVKVVDEEYGCGNIVLNKSMNEPEESDGEGLEGLDIHGDSTATESEWIDESSEEEGECLDSRNNDGMKFNSEDREVPATEGEGKNGVFENLNGGGGVTVAEGGGDPMEDDDGDKFQESGTDPKETNVGPKEISKKAVRTSYNKEVRVPRSMGSDDQTEKEADVDIGGGTHMFHVFKGERVTNSFDRAGSGPSSGLGFNKSHVDYSLGQKVVSGTRPSLVHDYKGMNNNVNGSCEQPIIKGSEPEKVKRDKSKKVIKKRSGKTGEAWHGRMSMCRKKELARSKHKIKQRGVGGSKSRSGSLLSRGSSKFELKGKWSRALIERCSEERAMEFGKDVRFCWVSKQDGKSEEGVRGACNL